MGYMKVSFKGIMNKFGPIICVILILTAILTWEINSTVYDTGDVDLTLYPGPSIWIAAAAGLCFAIASGLEFVPGGDLHTTAATNIGATDDGDGN